MGLEFIFFFALNLSNSNDHKNVKYLEEFGHFLQNVYYGIITLDSQGYKKYFQVCVKSGPRGHIFGSFLTWNKAKIRRSLELLLEVYKI